jgi:hypothetical protein
MRIRSHRDAVPDDAEMKDWAGSLRWDDTKQCWHVSLRSHLAQWSTGSTSRPRPVTPTSRSAKADAKGVKNADCRIDRLECHGPLNGRSAVERRDRRVARGIDALPDIAPRASKLALMSEAQPKRTAAPRSAFLG